jgi:hypothetical protein
MKTKSASMTIENLNIQGKEKREKYGIELKIADRFFLSPKACFRRG